MSMALPRKCCQSCGRELQDGETVIRVQRGTIMYSAHISLHRKASTDDYFCENCPIAVREAA